MEAERTLPDPEELETLAEMVGRVLRLHSAELNLDRSKPAFDAATQDSGQDPHARKSTRPRAIEFDVI